MTTRQTSNSQEPAAQLDPLVGPSITEPPVCCSCGCIDDLSFGPDPYAEEIGGNATPVWECGSCRYQSAMDI